jgi:hypothetical protein
MLLAAGASDGETYAFLVIGVLGVIISAAVYFVPGVFDAATRMRLRMSGQPEDDQRTLERDRQRRRFIALILGIGSAAVLIRAITLL